MVERDIMGLGKLLVPNYMCTWFHYTHLIHVWYGICTYSYHKNQPFM